MKTTNRFLFQVLLCFGIWFFVWIIDEFDPNFLVRNTRIFVFQIFLIGGIIYYAAPMLLFKKKQTAFFLITILAIFTFTYLSIEIFGPNLPKPPILSPLEGTQVRRGPSKFLVHFLFLSLTSLITIFFETFLFAKKKEQETILNKNEILQTELKLLKFQINPHFLFNTLNNIYTLSVIDSNKTQQSIAFLSAMLRYVLYDCEQLFVHIDQEVTYIENYLQLFNMKSIESYPIILEKNIRNSNTRIAPMMLIPFIENSLKHSHIEKRGTSFIHIKVEEDRGYVHFEIENSMPTNIIQKDNVGGIGLENVKKRLAIIYPKKHSLDIKEDGVTFRVNLTIDSNEAI